MGILGVSLAFAIGARPVVAEDVAPSYKASSDVYKMIAENEHFRVNHGNMEAGLA